MNAFTVDVEEWFHICGVDGALAREHWDRLPSRVVGTTDLLLDLLDDAGVAATFFVLGWVADRHPALIGRIQAAGHAVASHGYWHSRVYELSPAAFDADLARSVQVLHAAGAPLPTAYRAAEWSLNTRTPWAFDILTRHGFTLDASMAPVRIVGDTRYPRAPHLRPLTSGVIAEVPPFVTDRFGQALPLGWGWALRRARPRDVARAVTDANREGRPAVLTVHPWEVDPEPPRVRLPWRQHFAHYYSLDGFFERLRTILRSVPFSTLDSVARSASPL
jgi:polysaccharide deacetylase family protein (PEP-CTERM system associated)